MLGNENIDGIIGRSGNSPLYNCYNAGSVDKDQIEKVNIGSICGGYYGSTKIINCYYFEGIYHTPSYVINKNFETTLVTLETLKTGEIAYLLQGEQEEQVWGQNIDNDLMKDEMHNFTGDKVYKVIDQSNDEVTYTNKSN